MENSLNSKVHKTREEWIDLLRALAMFLVIVGHVYENNTFYQFINPIKMPLFYFLSGIFIGLNKDFGTFIKGLIHRLVVPWIVFSLFPFYAIRYAIGGDWDRTFSYIKGFFLGQSHWFITSFIVTNILCYALFHVLRKNEVLVLVAGLGCFFLGILLKDVPIMSIWTMDTALTGVLFAMLGKFFYNNRSVIMEKYVSNRWIFLASLLVYGVLVAVSVIYYPGQTMDFHKTEYYNPVLCLILIFTGIFCCIYISTRLKSNRLTKIIATMGQNTLVVYLFNGIVVAQFAKVFHKIGLGSDGFSLLESIIISVFACAICTVVSVICGKYCPILIGKNKK